MKAMEKRAFLAGVAGAVLFVPAFLRAQPALFRIGLTPVFLDNDWQLLDLIRMHLGAAMSAEVEFVQRRTYKEVTALLLLGEIEAAWLCGYPLLQHPDRLAALALPVWQGQPRYRAKIITAAGRGARTLADLRGDIHAYSDPDSNSGHLVTVSELLLQNHRPEAFFSRSFFTYGHRNVVRAVARGLAQSGSVDGYVYDAMQRAEPDLVARTQVLWESELFGFPPIVMAREAIGGSSAQSLFVALQTMPESEPGRAALQMLQLDGFTAPDGQDFDQIAARMRVLVERG